jgi:hypothetical protein
VPRGGGARDGAFAVIALGCINVRQALRVCDSRIIFLIGSSIAARGRPRIDRRRHRHRRRRSLGARRVSRPVMTLGDSSSWPVLTNILSNNATAVLFTPIAIGIAQRLGWRRSPSSSPSVLAANCSFATPVGYQTNLLVMGPGALYLPDFIRRRHLSSS